MPKRLSDEQNWTIINSPHLSDREVAELTGATFNAVHMARWRFKRKAWSCAVRYATCPYCGKPVTLRKSAPEHAYHRQCVRKLKLERLKEHMKDEESSLVRFNTWLLGKQEESKTRADRGGSRWTLEEDAIVRDLIDRPVAETCEQVHRTMFAVLHRRQRLGLVQSRKK